MPPEAAGETSRGFSAFLDEFVQDFVFLPQLEDKVQALFTNATCMRIALRKTRLRATTDSAAGGQIRSNVIVLIDSFIRC